MSLIKGIDAGYANYMIENNVFPEVTTKNLYQQGEEIGNQLGKNYIDNLKNSNENNKYVNLNTITSQNDLNEITNYNDLNEITNYNDLNEKNKNVKNMFEASLEIF